MTQKAKADLVYTLKRDPTRAERCFGTLTGPNIIIPIYTVEDKVREISKTRPTDVSKLDEWVMSWKIKGKTAIPTGRYRLCWTPSTRFKRHTLQLMDVPGFGGIRWHGGNTEEDTEGCLLPGLLKTEFRLYDSQKALTHVEAAMRTSLSTNPNTFIKIC